MKTILENNGVSHHLKYIMGHNGVSHHLRYIGNMARVERINIADYIHHVLNRANARVQIFDNENDYKQFENISPLRRRRMA